MDLLETHYNLISSKTDVGHNANILTSTTKNRDAVRINIESPGPAAMGEPIPGAVSADN